MTATNHAVTGSVIALYVSEPILAVPLAFASHFVLDVLPHFGSPGSGGFGELFKQKLSSIVIAFDFIGLILLAMFLLPRQPVAFLIGLVALSPDFVWLIRYFFYERKGKTPPQKGAITVFHSKIQRLERPWGIWVELLFLGLMAVLLYRLV